MAYLAGLVLLSGFLQLALTLKAMELLNPLDPTDGHQTFMFWYIHRLGIGPTILFIFSDTFLGFPIQGCSKSHFPTLRGRLHNRFCVRFLATF
jgi:hypothetical protein